jgi:hypothetical protein
MALAAFHFAGAGLQLVWLMFLVFGPPPEIHTSSMPIMLSDSLYIQRQVTTCAALIGIPVTLAVGIGLWRLNSWGRGTALVLYGIIVAVAVLGSRGLVMGPILAVTRRVSVSAILTALVFGAAFYYLCRSVSLESQQSF